MPIIEVSADDLRLPLGLRVPSHYAFWALETVVTDPECPADLWWRLAEVYPLEAQASVLYPLLTLEAPERWTALEEVHLQAWVEDAIKKLPRLEQQLLAVDCLERVLPLYEISCPNDARVATAISMRRKRALDKASKMDWLRAQQAAHDAFQEVPDAFVEARFSPARYTSQGAASQTATGAVWCAANAAAWRDRGLYENSEGPINLEKMKAAQNKEARWQWARLQQYRRGEA